MNIKVDGLQAKISKKEFRRLLEVYSPCDEIEVNYYIGSYYFSIDFAYWINGVHCVSFLTCDLESREEVADFVFYALAFGYKVVNLS